MSGDVLEVRDLSVDVIGKRGEVSPIVRNVSFSVAPGKVLALIGESGSGKTTISLTIMGYARPGCQISDGRIMLDGVNVFEVDNVGRQLIPREQGLLHCPERSRCLQWCTHDRAAGDGDPSHQGSYVG